MVIFGRKKKIKIEEPEDREVTISLGYSGNYEVDVNGDAHVIIGKVHGIGSREMQQDSFGVSELHTEDDLRRSILAVVADGMGGMSQGEQASMLSVVSSLSFFDENKIGENIHDYMLDMAENANAKVIEGLGENSNSGSTLICALFIENEMHFCSVGDSHILLYHDGSITQLNTDHIYANRLKKQVEMGLITQEEADRADQKGALTSFIGQDYLEEVDVNDQPVLLESGDRIIICSDGVYNSVSNESLCEAMQYPVDRSGTYIDMQITNLRKRNQDNYTALIIELL